MEYAEKIIDVIGEEISKVKKLLIRKTVVEGMGCEPGYIDVGDDGECVKEVKTVSVFLTTPIANTIVLTIFSFIFAGFLYKFKSTPIATNKNGTSCQPVPLNLLFQKNILEGVINPIVYNNKTLADKARYEKFRKIAFPSLQKMWLPAEVKLEEQRINEDTTRKMIPAKYIFMLPLYITLKFSTQLYYFAFSTIKSGLYRHKEWGGLQEIDKINKFSWLKDLSMVFFIIPFFILAGMPLIFLLQIVWGFIVAPLSVIYMMIQNKGGKMRSHDPDSNQILEGLKTFFKLFGWVIGLMFGGVAFTLVVVLLTIGWFVNTITGLSENKKGGPQVIFKTWGNIIWDYKYIWATLAIGIWLLNFEIYLRGPHNLLSFVNDKNRDMILGIIGGIAFVLFMGKQAKFFKYLPEKPKSRKECYPNCEAPIDINESSSKPKDCPDRDKV
tara:strand:- start:8235 stop:9554 length:1320 start_codon:yes stop_codon:yes gene_type:complete